MAISKKQGIAVGVGVVAIAAIVGGIFAAVNLNQGTAEAAAAPAATSANKTTDEIEWIHLDEPVAEAVAALKESGFTPVEPGKLTVAGTSFAPPLGYTPEGETKTAGTEPNIGSLIAEALGLEYNPVVVAWADWPLGIQSGKYDLITSNVTVKSDSKIDSIKEADDISGLKVIVGSGTNQEKVLLAWNEELTAAGKKPAELVYYEDVAASTLAIQSGRADATFGPNATAAWAAAETGDTKLVGTLSGGWPQTAQIAAATKKGNGLIEPVHIALNALIKDGKYDEVLKVWGLESERIDESEINPPGLPKS